jgi:DNA-binding NarL/FixJ family response regulator
VAVQSADEALRLLRQFRVRIVVLHASAGSGWQECTRVLGCGSPVAMVVDAIEPESTGRYLSAGCAAVIAASCTPDEVTAALARVADGQRDVVCPVPSTHALASASHRSSPVG